MHRERARGSEKPKRRTGGAGSRKTSPANSAERKPTDLAEIRRQITELVENGALGMVEITIAEVEKGHYLGMKYLFEMIGLYPATSSDDAPTQDSMAATLLRRLSLPEVPGPEPSITKDTGATAATPEDGLE